MTDLDAFPDPTPAEQAVAGRRLHARTRADEARAHLPTVTQRRSYLAGDVMTDAQLQKRCAELTAEAIAEGRYVETNYRPSQEDADGVGPTDQAATTEETRADA